MEYKSILLSEQKFIDERTVEGIANVTGILDLGNDRVMPKAYTKTLKESSGKVRHLWQHDFTQPPIAAIVDLAEVGRDELPVQTQKDFPEATGGLKVTRRYLETPRGNEVLAGIKSGAIKEMSIGFDTIKVEFKDEEQEENGLKIRTRIIREVRLWDTSDVNWGMNQATSAAKAKLIEATLPHHDAEGKVKWATLTGAMLKLMDKSCDIPLANREEVYSHLAKHYRELEQEPPDFATVQLVYTASRYMASDLLVPADSRITDSLSEIIGLLKTADPIGDRKFVESVTSNVLRKLSLAERELEILMEAT